MDRRDFLTAKRNVRSTSPSSTKATPASGLTPYTGTWGTAEVVHLLKRTMFGAKKTDIDYFKTKSISDAVDELVNPTAPMPSPPLKEYATSTTATLPDNGIPAGTTWMYDPNTDGTVNGQRRASFKKWWTGVMINQDRSVREKMTLFWANHFSTQASVINYAHLLYKHHSLLRDLSMGSFRTMVRIIATDPAMLIFLNGKDSSLTAPNENFARELQELYTIGKENTPNYTEEDVKAAAKVLTGFQVTVASAGYSYFTLSRHDKTNKQFSSFYNNTVVVGRSVNPPGYNAGEQELDYLMTMIFDKKWEVSRFIVKKIYRWFCYYKIDETIMTNVIDPLAKILQDSNWEIKPVLAALFKSEHFFDMAYRGCLIKSPVDFIIGAYREFNIGVTDTNYLPINTPVVTDTYATWEIFRGKTSTLNQDIGEPYNVAGWPAYYQEPLFHEIWISSDTLPKRNTFTDTLIGAGFTVNSTSKYYAKINPIAFTAALPNPSNPNDLLNDALDILFKISLSDASKATIKTQILLKGQVTDQYWTDAWNAYLATPAVTGTPYKTVLAILQSLYKYLMDLSEYQLM